MKIITKGEIPKPKSPAWVGLMMTCGVCNTVFELEEEDDSPREIATVITRSIIVAPCPFCKANVSASVHFSKI